MATVTSLRYHMSTDGSWRPCSAKNEGSCPLGASSGLGHVDAAVAQHMNAQKAELDSFKSELDEQFPVKDMAPFDYAEPEESTTPADLEELYKQFADEATVPAGYVADTTETEYAEDYDAYDNLSDEDIQILKDKASSLYVPEQHSYTEHNRIGLPDVPGRYHRWHGEKFDAEHPLDIAKVNAAVRKDLAAAVKAGYLPEGLQYSVHKAGDKTVQIKVMGVLDSDSTITDHVGRLKDSEAQKKLKKRLESIADQYNEGYDTGPYSDYPYQGHFFTSVYIPDEHGQKWERDQKQLAKNKRDSKKNGAQLRADYSQKGMKALTDTGFAFSHTSEKNGFSVGRVPNTDWIVVGKPNPIASGGYTLKAYDMGGVPSKKGRSYEEIFAGSNEFTIDYRFGRREFLQA